MASNSSSTESIKSIINNEIATSPFNTRYNYSLVPKTGEVGEIEPSLNKLASRNPNFGGNFVGRETVIPTPSLSSSSISSNISQPQQQQQIKTSTFSFATTDQSNNNNKYNYNNHNNTISKQEKHPSTLTSTTDNKTNTNNNNTILTSNPKSPKSPKIELIQPRPQRPRASSAMYEDEINPRKNNHSHSYTGIKHGKRPTSGSFDYSNTMKNKEFNLGVIGNKNVTGSNHSMNINVRKDIISGTSRRNSLSTLSSSSTSSSSLTKTNSGLVQEGNPPKLSPPIPFPQKLSPPIITSTTLSSSSSSSSSSSTNIINSTTAQQIKSNTSTLEYISSPEKGIAFGDKSSTTPTPTSKSMSSGDMTSFSFDTPSGKSVEDARAFFAGYRTGAPKLSPKNGDSSDN